MQITKKIIAVLMTLVMAATFASVAFATSTDAATQSAGKVVFTVGEYKDGAADVSVRLVDCVGLTSGTLNFGYDAKDVTKIAKKNGADVKAIGEVDNGFNAEFNNKINPVVFGFYFKNALWSSAEWAAAENAEAPVNGEDFEAAIITVTGNNGAVVNVTGELKIGEELIPVETSFTLVKSNETPAPVEHVHVWDAGTVTKEATCTEKGIKTFACVCGETKTEEIPALGHKTDGGKITKAATCTEKGIKTTTCTVCGASKTEEIAATGHKWDAGKVTKEATKTAEGEKTFTCSVCKATKTEKIPVSKDAEITTEKPTEKTNQKPVKTDSGEKETKKDSSKKGDGDTTTAAEGETKKASKDKGTGDNGILAVVAGIVVLAGAAVVVTHKKKEDIQ